MFFSPLFSQTHISITDTLAVCSEAITHHGGNKMKACEVQISLSFLLPHAAGHVPSSLVVLFLLDVIFPAATIKAPEKAVQSERGLMVLLILPISFFLAVEVDLKVSLLLHVTGAGSPGVVMITMMVIVMLHTCTHTCTHTKKHLVGSTFTSSMYYLWSQRLSFQLKVWRIKLTGVKND